jgi:hypothetical protein
LQNQVRLDARGGIMDVKHDLDRRLFKAKTTVL